jgi:hypothetical protein
MRFIASETVRRDRKLMCGFYNNVYTVATQAVMDDVLAFQQEEHF